MSKPRITVTMEGGVIRDIDWPASLKGLFDVVVMDFDDEADPDDARCRVSEDGDPYYETVWRDPDESPTTETAPLMSYRVRVEYQNAAGRDCAQTREVNATSYDEAYVLIRDAILARNPYFKALGGRMVGLPVPVKA